ncbi:MAG: hypothetical protein WCI20_13010, partial [bacterium]
LNRLWRFGGNHATNGMAPGGMIGADPGVGDRAAFLPRVKHPRKGNGSRVCVLSLVPIPVM